MFRWLIGLFTKPKIRAWTLSPTLQWAHWGSGTLRGFLADKPREGDLIITELKTGAKVVSLVQAVNVSESPEGLFTAECRHVGFEDEKEPRKLLERVDDAS